MQTTRRVSAGSAILLVLSFSACGKSYSKKLVGRWSVDLSEAKEHVAKELEALLPLATPEKKAEIEAQLDKVKGAKLVMNFKADGELVSIEKGFGVGTGRIVVGSYEIVKEDENTLFVKTWWREKGSEPGRITMTFMDDDTIQAAPTGGGQGPHGLTKTTWRRVK